MTTDGWSGSNDCRVLKNVGSCGEDGHVEAVRQNREVCPNHLGMDAKD